MPAHTRLNIYLFAKPAIIAIFLFFGKTKFAGDICSGDGLFHTDDVKLARGDDKLRRQVNWSRRQSDRAVEKSVTKPVFRLLTLLRCQMFERVTSISNLVSFFVTLVCT